MDTIRQLFGFEIESCISYKIIELENQVWNAIEFVLVGTFIAFLIFFILLLSLFPLVLNSRIDMRLHLEL